MEARMDLATFMSYVAAALFWVLVLANMAFATVVFCNATADYDSAVRELGVPATNAGHWFLGFIAIGMPVLQAGPWLHGSEAWAWGLLALTTAFWVFVTLYAASKR